MRKYTSRVMIPGPGEILAGLERDTVVLGRRPLYSSLLTGTTEEVV